jgi:hypothetical protein
MLEPITATLISLTAAISIISSCISEIIAAILTISGACASLSTILPPPKRNSTIYKWTYKIINIMGCNFGKAKNKEIE